MAKTPASSVDDPAWVETLIAWAILPHLRADARGGRVVPARGAPAVVVDVIRLWYEGDHTYGAGDGTMRARALADVYEPAFRDLRPWHAPADVIALMTAQRARWDESSRLRQGPDGQWTAARSRLPYEGGPQIKRHCVPYTNPRNYDPSVVLSGSPGIHPRDWPIARFLRNLERALTGARDAAGRGRRAKALDHTGGRSPRGAYHARTGKPRKRKRRKR